MSLLVQRIFRYALAATLLAAGPAIAQVIGGFDSTRGGAFSLADSSTTSDFRSLISTNFPSATITSSAVLSPAYLSTLNAVVLDSATGDTSAITPLSNAEKSALFNFVLGGGGVYILVDNNTFAGSPATDNANQSLISPFGLHVTGTLPGANTATVTDTAHPVTNGPFGTVTSVATNFPGFFDVLGLSTLLAQFSSTQPALAVLNRGDLDPGSGPVVFVSDSFPLTNVTSDDNQNLDLNTLAFILPEPGSCLALVTILGVMVRRTPRSSRYPKEGRA